MRKLFLAICFSVICLYPALPNAATRSVSNIDSAKKDNQNNLKLSKEVLEEKARLKQMNEEQMSAYLKDRLRKVVKTTLEGDEGIGGDGAINVQKTPEQLEMEKQAKKSTFERIYDNAMSKLVDTSKPRPTAPIYTEQQGSPTGMQPGAADAVQQRQMWEAYQREEWKKANIDVIDVELPPNYDKTLVPAKEHIPYFFSRIDLLPDGLIQVTDTIIAVANGEKLKNGIIRAFPRYVYTRQGERQKVDLNLLDVSINETSVPYKIVDRNNYFFLEPAQKSELAPGIYEYQFRYTLDNQLFQYDEFDEFYWNLTGSVWNLVIARAGAVVIMPPSTKQLGQSALSGYPGMWNEDAVIISQEEDNILGFVSQTPLFIGQAMQMIVSIPKGAVSNITLTKKFLRFINSYGDIIFSVLGLIAIAASYFFSWQYIRRNRNHKISGMHKEAPILRYLAKGLIDKKSFGAFLLDLYRKNIIDIEENDNNVLLVKKTDDLKSLSKDERRAIGHLFTGHEAILNINSYSSLKIKRAMAIIDKAAHKRVNLLSLKLNIGYLLFSVGMLLISEFFIAALSHDIWYNFIFMLGGTAVFAICLWVLKISFHAKWKKWLAKTTAVIFLLATMFIMLAIVSPLTVLVLLTIVYTIFEYSKLYAQRGGLLGASVKDAQEYQQLLVRKAKEINTGRDFLINQAAVFALDVEEHYPENSLNKAYYKLDIINTMISKI